MILSISITITTLPLKILYKPHTHIYIYIYNVIYVYSLRQFGYSTFWYAIHCAQYLQTVWWFHLLVCYSLRPIPPDGLVVPPSGMLFTAANTSRQSGGSTFWYVIHCAQYLQTVWWFHHLVCYSLRPIPHVTSVIYRKHRESLKMELTKNVGSAGGWEVRAPALISAGTTFAGSSFIWLVVEFRSVSFLFSLV